MSDGWRVRILLVHVELSSHPFFTLSLSKSTSMRKILSSRDATVMAWMFPVFTTSCSVTLAFSCFNGRLDNTVLAGKLTRMRPSAAVVEDSAGSTYVRPARNVLDRRPSPETSNFNSFFKGPGLALVSSPLQRGRFVCELTGRRAHTCFQQVSGFGFVSGQCVSKHQARWSPAKGHSHPFQASTSGSHVGGAAFVVDSSPSPGFVTKSNTLLQSMTLMAENRWTHVSLFSKQNAGNKTVANMHMIHSRCPNPELKALGQCRRASLFGFVRFPYQGCPWRHVSRSHLRVSRSNNVSTFRSSSPVLIFRRTVGVCVCVTNRSCSGGVLKNVNFKTANG